MANFTAIANKSIQLILLFLRNFSTNLYRRLLIGCKYAGIVWQKRRLGKQYRSFGENIYIKYLAGDVNPLLQEDVKDQMSSLQAFQDTIAGRRDAITQIREQIKATSYRLTAPPAPPATDSQGDEPPAL